MANGRFLISRDATGAYRWVLRDALGAALAESPEGFASPKACGAALAEFRKAVAKAEVIDLTQPAQVLEPKTLPRGTTAKKSTKKKVKR